jgi:phosphoglycerate kinase
MVAEAMIGPHNKHLARPFSLIGGGDTSAYVEEAGLTNDFDHVSTGGGAGLELMSGKKLPGIEALADKK